MTVTNYSFPESDGTYLDGGVFDGDMEIAGSTSIGSFDLSVGYFTGLEALYIEAGFPIGPIGFAVGYGSGGDNFYATSDSDAGLVNISLSGEKEIKMSDSYSLPVFGSFIFNPDAEAAFLVFGVSF